MVKIVQCDRCGHQSVMDDSYFKIILDRFHDSDLRKWDLCEDCKDAFLDFITRLQTTRGL